MKGNSDCHIPNDKYRANYDRIFRVKSDELAGMSLDDIADLLDDAARMGSDIDEPEGNCYIQMSDTLARKISKALRANNGGFW